MILSVPSFHNFEIWKYPSIYILVFNKMHLDQHDQCNIRFYLFLKYMCLQHSFSWCFKYFYKNFFYQNFVFQRDNYNNKNALVNILFITQMLHVVAVAGLLCKPMRIELYLCQTISFLYGEITRIWTDMCMCQTFNYLFGHVNGHDKRLNITVKKCVRQTEQLKIN